MYQLQEEGVQDIVNINKIEFRPHGDLVDQTISQYNVSLINSQDPQSQIKNDEYRIQGKNNPMKMFQKT